MQGSARIDELRQKFHENPRRYFAPLANEYRKAGDPEQAIAICRAHLAQQPAHMSGHVVYAQSLYDAGRIDESRVVFEKALSLDPDNAIVLRQLGDISRHRGDTAEAKHWYSRALEVDPNSREVAAYIAELTEPLTETEAPAAPTQPAAAAPEQPELEKPELEKPELEKPELEKPELEKPEVERPEVVANEPAELSVGEPVPAQLEQPLEQASAAESEERPAGMKDFSFSSDEFIVSAADVEVPLSEPAREPEVGASEPAPVELRDESDFEFTVDDDLPAESEEEFTTLPISSGSPFVTRTMADLYARQGYHEQALEVYRQLAEANPNDAEVAERIRELTPADAPTEQTVADSVPDSSGSDFAELHDRNDLKGFSEVEGISEEPAASNEPPSSAQASDSGEQEAAVHFTEKDLGTGDEWDIDSWAAGFTAEEVAPFDFIAANASEETSTFEESTEPAAETAPEPIADAALTESLAPQEAAGQPPVANAVDSAHEQIAEAPEQASAAATPSPERPDESLTAEIEHTGEFAAASLPPGVLNETRDEFPEADVFSSHQEEPEKKDEYEPEPEPESEHFVAYSPQPPEEEDLPHYRPPGPTIREFFATLGARRPPENGSATSFTAHAMVPEIDASPEVDDMAEWHDEEIFAEPAPQETQPADEFPHVSDALANLFPDSPVSEEDTRAAFALSGALSGQPAPAVTLNEFPPSVPSPAAAAPAGEAPQAAQESEEDIRRFREWLDGLADS